MARTANRYLKRTTRNMRRAKIFKAGNYLRLSMDSDYTGSDSLENQRKLAKEYEKNHSDIKIIKEYVDDGKSGTTFERSSFEYMMQDLKKGVINCVIVKDLSRFGREYIDTGNYIEKVFPFLGVRFISIVDRYDSEDSECDRELLLISLKNLMNEMYARDISKKVGSIYQIKQQERTFYRSSTIPYGYRMDTDGTNYCINDDAAAVVREIFRKYHEGCSNYAISMWLYENGVLTPKQCNEKGHVYRQEGDILKQWQVSTIKRLLSNPVYIGNIVRHKTEQSFYSGKKLNQVPEGNWVLISGNHTPIISEEMFSEVQEKLKRMGETYKDYRKDADNMKKDIVFEKNVFQGKFFCGDCNSPMLRVVGYKMNNLELTRIKIFKCSTHAKNTKLCDTRGIEEQVLCDILYTTIRKHISFIKGIRKLIDQTVKFSFEDKLKQLEKEKNRIQNSRILIEQEYVHIYSRYKSAKVTAAEFQDFRSDYLGKSKTLKRQLEKVEKSEQELKKVQIEIKQMFLDWLQFGNVRKLTEGMIESCIERIDIYSGNRIEIRLTYQDLFELLEKWKEKGGICLCL